MSDNHKVLITVPSVVSTRVSFLGGDAGTGSKHVGCCSSVENVKRFFGMSLVCVLICVVEL